MNASLAVALECPDGDDAIGRLLELVRPEFAVPIYRPDPSDPVLAGAPCAVAGCDRPARSQGLCAAHHSRWANQGQPHLSRFIVTATPVRGGTPRADEVFDLSTLPLRCRLELALVLQRRHDSRGRGLRSPAVRPVVTMLACSGADSLLELPLDAWIAELAPTNKTTRAGAVGFLRYALGELEDALGGGVEASYARDTWDARRLGVPVTVGHHSVSFTRIPQPWLRQAVKSWARSRLVGGISFGAIRRDATGLGWFASYLAKARPDADGASAITRPLLEDYLAHLACEGPTPNTSLGYLTALRGFLETARRRHLLAGLGADAAIYPDDLPSRPAGLPRFVTEDVMARLESDEMLSLLPDETTRHLVIVLIETGLRAGDACRLRIDCLVPDSTGWPCLRYVNNKVRAEQLVPLSGRAADAIRAQQGEVARTSPTSPWLFPAPKANPDGARPFTYGTLRQRLARFQDAIDPRDGQGRPVRVTAHQFRHTFGTRLINSGVPQHVVQRHMGHASPMMTATYARLHDSTLRAAFEAYLATRVDVDGRRIAFDAEAPTADAEWVKQHYGRIEASLPNGFCGRPPQQDCPHPNACLTCPDFQTTVEFLPVHRRQADETRKLATAAEEAGRERLADNHRRVLGHLERIIPALESLTGDAGDHEGR